MLVIFNIIITLLRCTLWYFVYLHNLAVNYVITVADEATPVASITWPTVFMLKCQQLKFMGR